MRTAANCCLTDGAEACVCTSDACCPKSYVFDATKMRCECHGDDCCPVDFVWNDQVNDCTCAGVRRMAGGIGVPGFPAVTASAT